MNIHEYQAKKVLKDFGVAVPLGQLARASTEALQIAQHLEGPVWVVKAQIHAGGRGKAGGVILCRSHSEVEEAAKKLIGSTLITHQTGPEGQLVRQVYIEAGSSIKRELYLSLVLDRSSSRIIVIASAAGGMNIEEVAEETPEKIMQFSIDPAVGIRSYQGRKVGYFMGLEGDLNKQMVSLLQGVYDAFTKLDCTQLEINPLVVTADDQLIALDAKISFDDNAIFRHPDIEDLRDLTEEDPMEAEARNYDLSYVKLDGAIGCMVNGAGLAMATMDIIKLHGGEPANFLDVGGGATKEKVSAAFKLILNDPNVKAVLVNIFGGIMRCDIIAEGILHAAKEVSLDVPLVVRLQGTNVEKGRQILADSGLLIITEDDLSTAAKKVVQVSMAQGERGREHGYFS